MTNSNGGIVVKKEDLIKLKEKISKLSDEEKKLRNLYLRKISSGELYGPMTGYPSIDKPWLKYYNYTEPNLRQPYTAHQLHQFQAIHQIYLLPKYYSYLQPPIEFH